MQSILPLQDVAYRYLQDAIVHKELLPNIVYSFNTISDQLNMSRTPVRDAARRLEQDGYIDISPSRGFMVHTLTKEEITGLYQTRCAIEGYCCREIAGQYRLGAADETMAALQDNLNRFALLLEGSPTPAECMKLDEEFHGILISALKNSSFDEIIQKLYGRIGQFRLQSLVHEGILDVTLAEHTRIVEAIRTGDEDKSYMALKLHLDTPLSFNISDSGSSDPS